jgi:O-antigen/teichoic acid export membrane protein
MNYIKKIIFSKPALVLLDQAIYSGTNFILMLFLAQKLDLKNFGLFSTLMLFVYLAMSITTALVIQPFQVSYFKIQQKSQYFIFLCLGILFLIALFIVIIKLLFFSLPVFRLYITYGNDIAFFIFGLLIQDFFRKFFLGLMQITNALVIDSLFLLLVIILFYVFRNGIQLSNTLWIISIANLVSSLPGILFIIKNFETPKSWKLFLENHIQQGKWLVYIAFLQWGSSNFFVLASGLYLGIEALGALRLVQSVFGVLNVALISIENYVLPKVIYFHHQSVIKAKKYLIDISSIGLILFGSILTFVFIFSDEIIILTGGLKYQKYGYVVKIMTILYLFIYLNYPIRIAIKMLVLNKAFFYGYVISFTLSALTFHFFLNYFNLYGAVAGLAINQLVMTFYWQKQLKKNQFQLWI